MNVAIHLKKFGLDVTMASKVGKDQSGKEFLAAGKSYTDADLKKMNFYVEGVEGSIPK